MASANGARVISMAATLDSVSRSLEILRLLEDGQAYGLVEIGRTLGLGNSRVHRMLGTLEAAGFITRQEKDRRYRLAFGGTKNPTSLAVGPLLEAAFPVMCKLRDDVGETVHLATLGGRHIYYLFTVESRQLMRVTTRVGARVPAHCAAAGKVLLGYWPDENIRRAFAGPLPKCTDRTIKNVDDLLVEVRETRRVGFGRSLSESEVGMATMAVPISAGGDVPNITLSISGPESRINPRRTKSLTTVERTHLTLLQKAAGSIATRI